MKLTAKTKLNGLVKDRPFLQDFLAGLSPRRERLRKPAQRRTVGRVNMLSAVSKPAGTWPLRAPCRAG